MAAIHLAELQPPHTSLQSMSLCGISLASSLQAAQHSILPKKGVSERAQSKCYCGCGLHSTSLQEVASSCIPCCPTRGQSAVKHPSVLALSHMWLGACRHWVHLAWDNRAIEILVHQRYPQLLPTFSRLKHTVMKGDIGRYLALHQ